MESLHGVCLLSIVEELENSSPVLGGIDSSKFTGKITYVSVDPPSVSYRL